MATLRTCIRSRTKFSVAIVAIALGVSLRGAPANEQVTQLLAAGKMTAPSAMSEEKAANPFLRADVPEVAKAVGLAGASPAEVFAEIRTRKNKF